MINNSRWAWRISRLLPALLVLAVVLIVALGLWLVPRLVADPESGNVSAQGSATPSAIAQPDPPNVRKTKNEIQRTLSSFASLYCGRDTELLNVPSGRRQAYFEDRIARLVTPEFLSAGLVSVTTPVDESIASAGGRVEVSFFNIDDGHFDDTRGDFIVTVGTNAIVPGVAAQKSSARYKVLLDYVDGTWLVSSAEELF